MLLLTSKKYTEYLKYSVNVLIVTSLCEEFFLKTKLVLLRSSILWLYCARVITDN